MGFKNRKSEFPNRRKLSVTSIEKNLQGEIVSITVDISRAEGMVESEGTPLNADVMNALVIDLVESRLSEIKNTTDAVTQPVYVKNSKIATTKFVWDVLVSLGLGTPPPGSGGGSSGS